MTGRSRCEYLEVIYSRYRRACPAQPRPGGYIKNAQRVTFLKWLNACSSYKIHVSIRPLENLHGKY